MVSGSGAGTYYQLPKWSQENRRCPNLFYPSIGDAHKRRWWLLITTTLENLFFSQLLFGWGSLLMMLKEDHYYEYLCEGGHDNMTVNMSLHTNQSSRAAARHLLSGGGVDTGIGCSAQDRILNIIYTVSLFSQTGSGFIIGALQDKYGYKIVRLGGSLIFTLAHLLLMCINAEQSALLIPFFVMGALSGNILFLTSLQVANLFGSRRGTVTGILIGAMSSCAVMFSIFKNFYDMGMTMKIMWAIIAAGGLFSLFNCLITWPMETIPMPDALRSRMVLEKLRTVNGEKADDKLLGNIVNVGRRMSNSDTYEWHQQMWTSSYDLSKHDNNADKEQTFGQSVCSGLYILGTMFGCIVFLRLLLYIGIMYLSLLKLADVETMVKYVEMFGYLQVICLVACPALNWLLDRGTNPESIKCEDKDEVIHLLKIRKLQNCGLVFNINSIILIIFGVCCLIPNLQLQVVTFIAHTVIRGTGMSALLGAYAVTFPFHLLGKVVGLTILIASLVDLVQSPLFILIDSVLNRDPFMIDVCLLVFSVLNFLLPLHLYVLTRRLKRQHAAREKNKKENIVKNMAEKGDHIAKKLMLTIEQKEAFV